MIKKAELTHFREALLLWFTVNARDLPWRRAPHWYKTFLSEFMLQQTRVEQVIPYFDKFYKKYPNIGALAAADEQEVLSLWAGLGYYSRARNLHKAAEFIMKNFGGEFPDSFENALRLPGVGQYTAHAVLSIAFNRPFAVVDGNIKRVLSRINAVKKDVGTPAGMKEIRELADRYLDNNNPSIYNEAMMELGALVCTPKNAACERCPVHSWCRAYKKGEVEKYPIKKSKLIKKRVYYYSFIIERKGELLIVKRPEKGLLASMWEFPTFEGGKNPPSERIAEELLLTLGITGRIISIRDCLKYQYTHLNACYTPLFVVFDTGSFIRHNYADHKWIKSEDFSKYPIHTAHKKLLNVELIFLR
jgi:A/G-specific adenine glycosylase